MKSIQGLSEKQFDEIEQRQENKYVICFPETLVDMKTGQPTPLPRGCFISNDRVMGVSYEKRESISKDRFDEYYLWMSRLFPDVTTRKSVLQILFFILSGLPLKKVIYLWGKHNNGKSGLIECVHFILGGLSKCGSESMLTNKADGTMMSDMEGRLLVFFDELSEDIKLGVALKRLTGNKKLAARAIYSKKTSFTVSAKFAIASNFFPQLQNKKDVALRARLQFIYMESVFAVPDNPLYPPIDPSKNVYPANDYYRSTEFYKRIAMPFFYDIVDQYQELKEMEVMQPVVSWNSKVLTEKVFEGYSISEVLNHYWNNNFTKCENVNWMPMHPIFDHFKTTLYYGFWPYYWKKKKMNLNLDFL